MKTIIAKLNNVRLCLEAHQHNYPHSEFADKISDIYEIIEDLKNNKFNIQLKNNFPECSDEVYESKINLE